MLKAYNMLSVDVEDWFHILDSPVVPSLKEWNSLPLRAEKSMEMILTLLGETNSTATFFWLAWMAERFPELVKRCHDAGHEVASHGYAHVLAYEVGPSLFEKDLQRAKEVLEDIIGQPVYGFRAPGFGVTEKAPWAFDVIKSVGYTYDSSVFPASRGHGGLSSSPADPYYIKTSRGLLPEIPMTTVSFLGRKVSFFGGGYLRLAPIPLIKWGINKLHEQNRSLVVYVHPREFDPGHPRLPLSSIRRFKCYVNLDSTFPKLKWLCNEYKFCQLNELANELLALASEKTDIPVVDYRAI